LNINENESELLYSEVLKYRRLGFINYVSNKKDNHFIDIKIS